MNQRRCVFLTMDDMGEYVSDDDLAIPELNNLGWDVEKFSWRADADWSHYDTVVIRTTWDYQDHPEQFFAALEQINASSASLHNPIDLVRWNMRKTYLRDLSGMGLAVVPTLFGRGLRGVDHEVLFASLDADEVVIKPVVSATAQRTFRVARSAPASAWGQIEASLGDDEYLVQPFMHGITDEGEYSVMYLAGTYSHAILKSPRHGDFRVQEEHGGVITAVQGEPELLKAAGRFVGWIDPAPLYARVDLVRSGDRFLLMELELIEPSLYLRMDVGAPARFAGAIDGLFKR